MHINFVKHLDQAIFGSLLVMVLSIPLSESIKSVFFVIALLCWTAKMTVTRDFSVRIPLIGWFFLGWLGAVFLSSLGSDCTVLKGISDVLLYTLFFFIIVNAVDSASKILAFIWTAIIGIGLGDLWGIYDFFLSGQPRPRLRIGSLGFTGAYLAMIFSLVIGLWMYIRFNSKQHLFLITVTGLSGIALIFTYTRSMWMIVILVMILAAVLSRAWWPVMAAIVLTAFLGISATMSPMIQNRIVHLANPLTDQSLAGRFAIWEGALKMFEESPVLGVGSKCFKPSRDQYGIPEYGGQAHNLLIHVAAELGSVGVMALLAWLGAYLHFLIRLRHQLINDVMKALWFAAVGSFLTILIGGIVDPTIGSEVSLMFLLITGLLIVAHNIAREKKDLSADSP